MQYKLSAKQKKIYASIKELAAEHINTEMDFKSKWDLCAKFGILSSMMPQRVGGLAENYSDILFIAKILGELIEDSGFAFTINNSMIIASYVLPEFADETICREICPGLQDGSLIASYAITEPQSGSDVYTMNTIVHTNEDALTINGSKTYISNAPISDIFVVVCKNDQNSYSAILVKKGDEGFSIGSEIKKMGLKTSPMSEIYFTNCTLPKSRVIGSFTNGQIISNMVLDWERCLSFASHLGCMTKIMNKCISYANQRVQFGKNIGSFQLVSEKIARMRVNIELGELLLYKICDMKDNDKKTFLESAIFKYFIGEHYASTCLDALQIFGAYGYCEESGIEKAVRDSLGSKIYSGTSEIQLEIISRMIGIKR